MVSKVYAVICSLFAITATVLILTGNFPVITAVIFGLVAFGLVFMGMMFVLPYTMMHASPVPAKREAELGLTPVSSFGRAPGAGRQVQAQQALTASARVIEIAR